MPRPLRPIPLFALTLVLCTVSSAPSRACWQDWDYWDNNLRIRIEADLAALDPDWTGLTAAQVTELDDLKADHCNSNSGDMLREYHQRITYFHLDNIHAKLALRLAGAELTTFQAFKDRRESMIANHYTIARSYWNEEAREVEFALRNEFRDIIRSRVCAIDYGGGAPFSPCAETPNEGDIHRALYWAFLAYRGLSDVRTHVVHDVTTNNVYHSGDVVYYQDYQQNTGHPIYDWLVPHYSRAFIAVMTADNGSTDIVISFRGTNPTSMDAITDMELWKVPHGDLSDDRIKVHHGFQSMWQQHRSNVLSTLDSLLSDTAVLDNLRTIYVTGHSLGAAVATVALPKIAMHLHDNYSFKDHSRLKMINFGSPRTGNPRWVNAFKSFQDHYSYLRIWNERDIVTAIPYEDPGIPFINLEYAHIDRDIRLPTIPNSWWPSTWTDSIHIGSFDLNMLEDHLLGTIGLEGHDVRHHSSQAYQFNTIRHIPNLSWTDYEHPSETSRVEHCVAQTFDRIYFGSSYFDLPRLYDLPCTVAKQFACERVSNLQFPSDIGPGAVTWDSEWIKTSSSYYHQWGEFFCPSGYHFGIPSRTSDLVDIMDLLIDSHDWIWVNLWHRDL